VLPGANRLPREPENPGPDPDQTWSGKWDYPFIPVLVPGYKIDPNFPAWAPGLGNLGFL